MAYVRYGKSDLDRRPSDFSVSDWRGAFGETKLKWQTPLARKGIKRAFENPPRIRLEDAVRRPLRLLAFRSRLPLQQRERLSCVLTKILEPNTDDRYINGLDINVRNVTRTLTPDRFNAIVSLVRRDVTSPLFAPANESDDYVLSSLDALDTRINGGIGFLHKHVEIQGPARNPGKLQMRNWIKSQQQNSNSIYFCYGLGQD